MTPALYPDTAQGVIGSVQAIAPCFVADTAAVLGTLEPAEGPPDDRRMLSLDASSENVQRELGSYNWDWDYDHYHDWHHPIEVCDKEPLHDLIEELMDELSYSQFWELKKILWQRES